MFDRVRSRFQREHVTMLARFAEESGHPEIADQVHEAGDAMPLLQLLAALAPFIIALISGSPVNWAELAALLANLLKPKPVPVPALPA